MTKFSEIYPNIATWTESYGWIEIGQDDESSPHPSSPKFDNEKRTKFMSACNVEFGGGARVAGGGGNALEHLEKALENLTK